MTLASDERDGVRLAANLNLNSLTQYFKFLNLNKKEVGLNENLKSDVKSSFYEI
jgi:hypothetical protein